MIYVDDLVIASNVKDWTQSLKDKLINTTYDKMDQGDLRYCLGMLVERDRGWRILCISQEAHTTELLARYSMLNSRPVSTPEVEAPHPCPVCQHVRYLQNTLAGQLADSLRGNAYRHA